jgi:hypothetical protein
MQQFDSKPSEKYVYIFVRQDMPFRHQLIQYGHAIWMMASLRGYDEASHNQVAIGVPDQLALERVQKKLQANQIQHYPWVEPDNALGFTAICTAPIEGVQRELLRNYRCYNDSPGTGKSVCLGNENGGANTRVVQCQDVSL